MNVSDDDCTVSTSPVRKTSVDYHSNVADDEKQCKWECVTDNFREACKGREILMHLV